MSWDEVKKINSDLSVPLDERASYIAGMIPRGRELHEINIDATTTQRIVYENTGKSYIESIALTAVSRAPSNVAWGDVTTVTANIYSGDSILKTLSVSVTAINGQTNTNTETVLKTDLEQLYKTENVYNELFENVKIDLKFSHSGYPSNPGSGSGKINIKYIIIN